MITINENLIVLDSTTSLGGVVEAIQNQPARASEIRDALMLLITSIRAEGNQAANTLGARIDTVTATLTAEKESALAALTDAHNTAVAAVNAERNTLSAQLATVSESLAAVTTDRDRIVKLLADASAAFDAGDVTTLQEMRAAALQTETEKKLAAARAKKAEAESEIAALAALA